ncbi:MAG: hypothetical protein M1817_005207 [Caeruleum heppii]|nr:MAG: hypothetical protein M1817_005207 [Caeruleum heppii]
MSPVHGSPLSPAVATLSSPVILDSDMGDALLDSDLDFFNTPLAHDSPSSVANLLDDDILATSSEHQFTQPFRFPGPANASINAPLNNASLKELPAASSPLIRSQPLLPSHPTSVSPPSSSQGSSSDSSHRHKRKSSSTSSRSARARVNANMTEDVDMGDWKVGDLTMEDKDSRLGELGGSIFPHSSDPLAMDTDFETSNQAMAHHFDFESAASSPSGINAAITAKSLPHQGVAIEQMKPETMRVHRKFPSNGQNPSNGFSLHSSREASPLSAMLTSHESSPTAYMNTNTPSPGAGAGYVSGMMLSNSAQASPWNTSHQSAALTPSQGLPSGTFPPRPHAALPATSAAPERFMPQPSTRSTLYIHPTPLKSRVETQIPIKMTLWPMPPRVTKLHLPTHSISKAKLLAKPSPSESPDTLELHTMVVCTSAMQTPARLQRAFARAAGQLPPRKEDGRRSSAGDDPAEEDEEDKPLNGGEVNICLGCITRERKRAARKKVKKVEEEESWHKDEHKRIIVFNTNEIKEWQAPSQDDTGDDAGNVPQVQFAEGAMQVDAPMRIACYCRHLSEKLGFQVIFTIKDHESRVVAQAITSSIMITDDHKTAGGSFQPTFPDGTPLRAAGAYTGNMLPGPTSGFSVPAGAAGASPFRLSHSSSDLQGLQNRYTSPYGPTSAGYSLNGSQNTSASSTPRNVSRQVSPQQASGSGTGHAAKKRKSSGSSKVPSGLAMTKLETSQAQASPNTAVTAPIVMAPTMSSPFTPGYTSLPTADSAAMTSNVNFSAQHHTGPPTPNSNDQGLFGSANRSQSMENLSMPPNMFSAPASNRASRAPSPNSLQRPNAGALQQAQMAQAVANGIYGLPLALNPHRPPTIHKLIPNEGPRSGGVEITCLGGGFCQGLEVMFGDVMATTTTYWGETSLVCLLPPAIQSGTVPVRFKHERQQQQMQPYPTPPVPKQQVLFTYVDDDEQQLMKMALSVVGQKMTGRMTDVRDIARRIVGNGPMSWASPAGGSPTGSTQQRQAAGLDVFMSDSKDVEANLLKCLDLIDLDDSPFQARLNMRGPSGQTMLHLACSLGMHRFVAALLARGAHPEPRDKGGFSPMHFAALHDEAQIVRRLMLSGADPTMRTLQGYTPADLARSEQVLKVTRTLEYHPPRRGAGLTALGRKANSATSLRSLWGPSTTDFGASASGSNMEDSDDDSYEDGDEAVPRPSAWDDAPPLAMAEMVPQVHKSPSMLTGTPTEHDGTVNNAASIAAWRTQLSAQLQHLQQTVNWNLPNLPQIPTRLPIPGLPDYQNYLAHPISALVPHRSNSTSRPSTAPADDRRESKETEYRWWELFSTTATAPPPPAYEDIYPQSEDRDLQGKKDLVLQVASDVLAQQSRVEATQPQPSEPSKASSSRTVSTDSGSLRFGGSSISREEQERIRAAHARKIKKIKSDRNLFFIWIPLLVFLVVAMLRNRLPEAWTGMGKVYGFVRQGWEGRVREVV